MKYTGILITAVLVTMLSLSGCGKNNSDISSSNSSVSSEVSKKIESSESNVSSEVSKNIESSESNVSSEVSKNIESSESNVSSEVSKNIESSESNVSSEVSKNIESSESNVVSEISKEESKIPEHSVEVKKEVESSWFDDTVFVGDSVTLKLSYYAENGSLGKAEFLCAGSLGYGSALQDIKAEGNVHPTYEGEKYTVDDGVKMLGAKKVFIMFGMNDIGLYGIDDTIENMKTLTSRIKKKSPEVEIYIQSVTPMLENMQLRDLNNKSISEFNKKLKAEAKKLGYKYLDVASVMKDKKGNLIPEYCSDPEAMGIHFSDEGCKAWVEYLKQNVADIEE
ncbi:MAG: GDSL-type esterase/lipase family protein [Clostridia bacterium]|nr:GDSL-type esterase/lipase family protein [Clostridia bacterium]